MIDDFLRYCELHKVGLDNPVENYHTNDNLICDVALLYKPLLKSFAVKFYNIPEEDILSCFEISLINSLRNFNKTKTKYTFGVYFKFNFYKMLCTEHTKRNSAKREIVYHTSFIEYLEDIDVEQINTIADDIRDLVKLGKTINMNRRLKTNE